MGKGLIIFHYVELRLERSFCTVRYQSVLLDISLYFVNFVLNVEYEPNMNQRINARVLRSCTIDPHPNEPLFLRVCNKRLLKTLWKDEKFLIMSNFSFPTVFPNHWENFLPFSSTLLETLPPISSNLKLSPANSFSLEESKICRLGKG